MPDLKPHTLDPYTQERADRLHRSYLEMNSVGLAVMSIGHMLLGLLYGDHLMALYFGSFVVVGTLYGLRLKRISYGTYVAIGEILIVTGVSGSQLVLPEGAASAVLLFPMGVTLIVLSQNLVRGASIFVFGLALFFSFRVLGVGVVGTNAVPEILSYCVTLFYCGIILATQVNRVRGSVDYSLSKIVTIEGELIAKEDALKKYQETLSVLNLELAEHNDTLLGTLRKESETNTVLERERANQEELTKAIHRDLRDPLRSIVAASKELDERFEHIPETNSVKSYLGFAIDGANRMTTMLDDLLEYTKGNDKQELESVDLSEVVVTLERDLSDLLGRSGATLRVGELPVVKGYSTQLVQLFQNLLSNALKFSRPGVSPHVSIFAAEVQDNPGRFMVRVLDNGVGIPANQIEGIFGLFNRAHSEDGYEGSGVGLALCRRIAVAHDATLTVASIYGEGSQFTISFPLSSIVEQPRVSPIMPSALLQNSL